MADTCANCCTCLNSTKWSKKRGSRPNCKFNITHLVVSQNWTQNRSRQERQANPILSNRISIHDHPISPNSNILPLGPTNQDIQYFTKTFTRGNSKLEGTDYSDYSLEVGHPPFISSLWLNSVKNIYIYIHFTGTALLYPSPQRLSHCALNMQRSSR